jgi:uncharacterized membrane protein YoaK (UPF0700 family)
MKGNFVKVIMIFLSFMIAILMAVDVYIFIVAYKMTLCTGTIKKIDVMFQHNAFNNIWILTEAMFVSVILLLVLLGYIIKEFSRRRKLYYLKEVIDYNVK